MICFFLQENAVCAPGFQRGWGIARLRFAAMPLAFHILDLCINVLMRQFAKS